MKSFYNRIANADLREIREKLQEAVSQFSKKN